MKIIQKVLIKQIITEKSKAKLEHAFEQQKMRPEQACQQLRFEKRKLQNKHHVSKQDIDQRFNQEINKRKEQISLIDFKLEQLTMLEIGHEIVEKEVEALVDVEEGVHWTNITNEKAIIIKDDVVIRIDE